MSSVEGSSRQFAKNGYAVCHRVLDRIEIEGLANEANRLRKQAVGIDQTTWDGPIRWLVQPLENGERVLRGVQFAHKISTWLDGARTAPSIGRLLLPLIGPNIVSVLSTLFWKPTESEKTVIAYHQDSAFRKPAGTFRNLANSYVQMGLAIDPHGPRNGGMQMVKGSHRRGDLNIERTTSVMSEAPSIGFLEELGFSANDLRDIEMDAGSVVIWHPHLLHGSPANPSSDNDRLFFVVGYMRQSDTDHGDLAFKNGDPCPYGSAQ